MTKLVLDYYNIPAAELGPENPLPYFRDPNFDLKMDLDDNVPQEDRKSIGWQAGFRVLPHRMQDVYNRDRKPKSFKACVLENDKLRAVLVPELGGRMMSLVHKASSRELLDRNPVWQPANLALRNAWFCGGVEWNSSHFGHHYLTCSPVFAAKVRCPDGYPVLRLYEWDRVKRFLWQIDFHLPPGSDHLFVRVRLANTNDEEIPVYWWTNIGVPEAEGSRVLAPADEALRGGLGKLRKVHFPKDETTSYDSSYATNIPSAQEYYFRVLPDSRKWVTCLDKEGKGLAQTSTDRLCGRKFFVFGMNSGGRHWQEYLASEGHAYLEIQAGLTRIQPQCIPMPAGAEWTWTECYGLLEADPAVIHGSDWTAARVEVEKQLESRIPRKKLEDLHERFGAASDIAPDEMFANGSGWGFLEMQRQRAHPERKPKNADAVGPGTPFPPDSLTLDQSQWMALLDTGELPENSPESGPGCYMVQPEWQELLEKSIQSGASDHWLGWLHLGVMRLEAGDADGARIAWETSVSRTRTSWAFRNLAVLERRAGNLQASIELLRQAWETGPQVVAIGVEYLEALVAESRFDEILAFTDALPPEIRSAERICLSEARAKVETGRLGGVLELLDREFATIREGESSLSDIWFGYHEKIIAAKEGLEIDANLKKRIRRQFPPPRHLDFRMTLDESEAVF